MAFITVTNLATKNTAPILTGTVLLDRKHGDTIKAYVNYVTYTLFDGRLGLDEKKNPNIWKLHFDQDLYPGSYDVEAEVINKDGRVVASVAANNALIILEPTPEDTAAPSQSLSQKTNALQALKGMMNMLSSFGGGPYAPKGVHPTQEDTASTTMEAQGTPERNQTPTHNTVKKMKRDEHQLAKPANVYNDSTYLGPYDPFGTALNAAGGELGSTKDATGTDWNYESAYADKPSSEETAAGMGNAYNEAAGQDKAANDAIDNIMSKSYLPNAL